ncbi:MAG: TlpA family protein disulfide reductase [Acidobacteria bacterium]|nr:TlpA family protein disulfide reductase [Acidobacteriota bacterium]
MRPYALLFLAAWPAWAGAPCAPSREVRDALSNWQENYRAPLSERVAKLNVLAAKYPGAIEVQRARMQTYRWSLPDQWPAVRDAYVKNAETRSDDPMALTLGAEALHRLDTKRAIALLEKARQVAPDYPWAALKLADIYQAGKFADKEKARQAFDNYAQACPDRITGSSEWVMSKVASPATQAAIARALRARLEKETDAKELLAYPMLWGLEFRTRPPQEHPALRRQVARDLDRLSNLNDRPDARWMEMLESAAKQSGAPEEAVNTYRDRLLKEFPSSAQAYRVAYDRWKKENKEPADHKDAESWLAWKKKYLTALKEWAAQFTDAEWLKDSYLSLAVELRQIGEREAVAAAEQTVRRGAERNGPSLWTYANAADLLLREGWAPGKALAWMEKAWALAESEDRRQLEDDTLTDERRKEIADGRGYRGYAALRYLQALRLAGKRAAAASLRAFVEGPSPAKKSGESGYWWGRGRLAALDGRTADALTYYQSALLTREKTPQLFQGVLRDELLDDARAVFLKNGGTESAFALWSKPRDARPQELAEGHWEKPTKALPAFELADLSGKTWKLKQLEGKALLINLWATWCGPCRAELPHFQELHEKTRERTDVQVISFNVDEEMGLVEPYMKENKYTFPALLAYGFVRGLFDGYGIPQNWVVNPQGKWIAAQIGFDASDADWVGSMIQRLEAAKGTR